QAGSVKGGCKRLGVGTGPPLSSRSIAYSSRSLAASDLGLGQARRCPPRPQRAGNGQGRGRMLQRGVTADTTGGVWGIKGAGETGPRKTDKLLRILVVEDNRDSADSLRLLLELSGHEVAVAYSGHDGVRAAGQYQPDVVLCDIGLPGLDGYGVARELR